MFSQATELLEEALAPATRKLYNYWFGRYKAFRASIGMGKEKLTVQMLLAFFMHIVNNSVNKGPLVGHFFIVKYFLLEFMFFRGV